MSSIKPPGGKPPVDGTGPAGPLEGPERSGPSFGEALRGATEAQPTAATAPGQAAQAANAAEPLAELARAVEAGELDLEQAVERLLERSVGSVEHHLSPQERAELLGVLRAALDNDPTLAQLKGG